MEFHFATLRIRLAFGISVLFAFFLTLLGPSTICFGTALFLTTVTVESGCGSALALVLAVLIAFVIALGLPALITLVKVLDVSGFMALVLTLLITFVVFLGCFGDLVVALRVGCSSGASGGGGVGVGAGTSACFVIVLILLVAFSKVSTRCLTVCLIRSKSASRVLCAMSLSSCALVFADLWFSSAVAANACSACCFAITASARSCAA